MAKKNKHKRKTKAAVNTTKGTSISVPKTKNRVAHDPFYKSSLFPPNIIYMVAIFCLPFLLYITSLDFGYVLDDQIVITDNSFTKQGFAGIDDLLLTESMTGYFGEQKDLVQGNRYRPLSLITFAMEYGISGGLNPKLSHGINILLYSLTGVLLFVVLLMMFRNRKPSFSWLSIPFLASLMFITHPIHTEAVANIKGRDEILALLFSLLTLFFTMKYVDNERKVEWSFAAAISFFLALLAKENSITFLAIIPLTIYFFSNHNLWGALRQSIILFLVTGVYLTLRFIVAGVPQFGQEINDLMNNPFLGMSGGEKMATIMFTLFKYLQLFVFPHPLSHDYYPYAIPVLGWGDIRAWGSLLLHIALIGVGLFGLRKKKIYSYAILFYFITLTIVSNIVINLGTFMNERFIYMASVGLSILVAYLLSEKLGKWKPQIGAWAATAIAAVLVIGYGFKTMERVPDWESALTLNQSAVKHGTNSARANSFMATALYEEAKDISTIDRVDILKDAYAYAEKAIKIHPKYKNAHLMKAGIAAELYKSDRDERKLLERFAEVMAKRPDVPFIDQYLEYLEGRTSDIDYLLSWYVKTANNEVMKEANLPNWALHYLNRAFKLDKRNVPVLESISKVYGRLGDNDRALTFQELANQAK